MQAAVDEWQEENVKETESKAHYKNMAPKRPVCQKLEDHITLGVSRQVGHILESCLCTVSSVWLWHFYICPVTSSWNPPCG